MKRSTGLLALLVLVISAFSMFGASAHCGTDSGRNSHDPFGSCEESTGNTKCGTGGTVVPGVGTVYAGTTGVAGCADDDSALPISGRLGVYNSNGHAGVFADGDDQNNVAGQGGAGGWDRVDVNTGTGQVCVNRGSGTWWTTGGGHSNPDPGPAGGACTP